MNSTAVNTQEKIEAGDVYLHCGHVVTESVSDYIWIKPEGTKVSISPEVGKALVATWIATCNACYEKHNKSVTALIDSEELQSYEVYMADALKTIPMSSQPPIDRLNLESEILVNLGAFDACIYKLDDVPYGAGERYLHCGHPKQQRAWYALNEPIVIPIPVVDKLSIITLINSCRKCLHLREEPELSDIFTIEGMHIAGDGEINGTPLDLPQPFLKLMRGETIETNAAVYPEERFIGCGHLTQTSYWFPFVISCISSEGDLVEISWIYCCPDCVETSSGNLYLVDYASEGTCKRKISLCSLS